MPASIVLTGLAANDPVPGVYTEVNFAQGNAAGSGSPRTALFICNKSTAGSATTNTILYGPDTQVPLQTEADVIALAGAGSPAHRAFRKFTKVNRTTSLYMIFVPESAGTAANLTSTLTSTATANGNIRTWIGDEFVDTAIVSGDTPTVIGANVQTNVNAMIHWAVTMTSTAGAQLFTAKLKGPRGNYIRIMQAISSSGTIATTTSVTSDTPLTSGATADSNAAALTTILARKFYYIVSEAEDATQLGAVVSQVGLQALPTTGIRQRTFAGSVDTIANVITVATGLNAPRAEVIWSKNSDWTPFEIAANACAVYALLENSGTRPRNNYSGFPSQAPDAPLWNMPVQRDPTVAPTRADIKSALMNGVTPIGVIQQTNSTYIAKRVTTRSLNGATADYRIRDAHKVTIMDFFADDWTTKQSLQFSGKDLSDDPVVGQPPPGPQIVFPRIVKAALLRLIDEYAENGLLQQVAATKAGCIVQRETNPTTRMSTRAPLFTVDVADQFASALDQVG